eukprot:1159548-Pelagomonas_calceolata.AAC.10
MEFARARCVGLAHDTYAHSNAQICTHVCAHTHTHTRLQVHKHTVSAQAGWSRVCTHLEAHGEAHKQEVHGLGEPRLSQVLGVSVLGICLGRDHHLKFRQSVQSGIHAWGSVTIAKCVCDLQARARKQSVQRAVLR